MYKVLSFFIPLILYTNYNLNSFYTIGSTLLDTGWFLYLSTNVLDIFLQNPPVLLPTHLGDTYLNTHISIIFYILAVFYKTLFFYINPEIYFAIVFASFYALISLSTYIIGSSLKLNSLILLLVSILTAFNAQSLATVGFTHFEILIPSLILLFLSFSFTNNRFLSYITYILLLFTREDAGFHFFGFIFVFVLIEYLQTKSIKKSKKFIKFALFALIYSISVILMQKYFFHTDDAFIRIYSGYPFYEHINKIFILNRLDFLISNREYLYIPIFITIFFSIVYKNYYLLIPFISILPWTILSITAITPMAGTLSNYYAFVFVLTLAFTPYAIFLKLQDKSFEYKKQFFIFLLIPLTSILLFPKNNGNVDPSPWKHFDFTYLSHIEQINNFKEEITLNKQKYKNILFDEYTSIFFVNNLQPNEYGYLNNFSKSQIQNVDTVIFNKSTTSNAIMSKIIASQHLSRILYIKNTDIVIARKGKLE